MSKNKKLRLKAEKREFYSLKQAKTVCSDGQKDRSKPLSIWGRGKDADPAIQISTPRSRRNKYQQSRSDRLKVQTTPPPHWEGIEGKMRGGLQWNNEGGVRQVWRD